MAMEEIRTFARIYDHLGSLDSRKRIAVVCPDDACTRSAIAEALKKGLADFLLVSTSDALSTLPEDISCHVAERVMMREASSPDDAAAKAVEAVRAGEADILMKGLINTDNFLRAILNKERGLLPKGNVLTHLSVAQLPGYHKLIFFGVVAVIPYPTIQQRV